MQFFASTKDIVKSTIFCKSLEEPNLSGSDGVIVKGKSIKIEKISGEAFSF